MRLNKKGDISLQFNWIFIVIAGAVLLAFFVGITIWQMNSNEKEKQISIISHLDTSLESVEQSVVNAKDALHVIKIPSSQLEYSCGDTSELRVKGTSYSESLATNIWFSKKSLQGDKLQVWTSRWEAPFVVAPFVYVDDGKTLFVFVNTSANSGIMENLYEHFLYNGSKRILTINNPNELNSFYQEGFDEYRFVFFNESPTVFGAVNMNFKVKTFSAVNIIPNSFETYDSVGKIAFYTQNYPLQFTKEIPFIRKELVFGAIFSESADTYECTMKKALGRMRRMAEVNAYKANALKFARPECNTVTNPYYYWPETYLNALQDPSLSAEDMYKNMDRLEKANYDLNKVSCPVIY